MEIAPERIWAWVDIKATPPHGQHWHTDTNDWDTEYVRADLHAAAVARADALEADVERLRGALEIIGQGPQWGESLAIWATEQVKRARAALRGDANG